MMRPDFKKISDTIWEIPTSYKPEMLVPARVIATKNLLDSMEDIVFDQLTNVATLPGIIKYALAMPDAHVGYGAPIGCVAAFDKDSGVIVPGIVGFDINCGMRLVVTNLTIKEVLPKIEVLVGKLFDRIPAGVGAKGFIKLNPAEFEKVMAKGAGWAIEKGFGVKEDLESIEEGGAIAGADPASVSQRARERGINQLGTLGSGNHYLEVQKVGEVFIPEIAKKLGVTGKDQIVVMVHCGSRGFGHQVGTDYLRIFEEALAKYKITVTDKQLAAAPFKSPEGQSYYSAMAAAANLAFCNRQVITAAIRQVFESVFGSQVKLNLVYDVAHNIAKIEEHDISEPSTDYSLQQKNNKKAVVSSQKAVREVLVLRKGATRAFGRGNRRLPAKYYDIGQPVIIGGSMETSSYLLQGLVESDKISFASTAHGSGRRMSRKKAAQTVQGKELAEDMRKRGIYVKAVSFYGLAEEAGVAYKDISEVIKATELAGISAKIAKFTPIGNIKG